VPAGLSVSRPAIVGDLLLSWSASSSFGCGTVSYTVELTRPGLSPVNQTPITATSYDNTESGPGAIAACPYPTVNCSTPRVWNFRVFASSAGGTSAFSWPVVSGTPRLGYVRDNVVGIWTTTLSNTTCTACHRPNGSGLPLDLSGTSTNSYNSIAANSPPVINTTTVTRSYLLACPLGDPTICPFTTMTTQSPHFFSSTLSAEYQVIQQWIIDTRLP
jgi:hypothetical protein